MAGKSLVFKFGDVEVREREFSLTKAGKVLPVEPKAFRVLLMLLRNPQKLIPKEELLNAVWGDAAVTENSLTRSVALLRRLLGDEIRNPRFIETVATVGYRLICKVEVSEDDSGNLEGAGESGGLADTGSGETRDGRQSGKRPTRLEKWSLASAAALTVGCSAAIWYFHRPLLPPRISAYTQITHEGHYKVLGGTDGNRLYFTLVSPRSPDQVSVTGGEIVPIPLTIPEQFIGLIDVSPDGANLLIASMRAGKSVDSLWAVRALGGSHQRVADSGDATFSPDGGLIAYSVAGDIWVMRNDGSDAHKLASVGGAEGPAWSPDGGRIRFTKEGRIWEISSDGSGLHPVFSGQRVPQEQCCGRWTRDGKFFVFLSEMRNPTTGQIWASDERRGLLRPPPAEPVHLTSGPIAWQKPIPSKNGSQIFAGGMTYRGELTRFDPHTRDFQPYVGGISALGAAFSKDGRFVTYVSYPGGILWKADRDGSNAVQLTAPPIDALLPRWSPDGTQILFSDWSWHDRSHIFTVSPYGGSPQRTLPEDDRSEGEPTWSHDGREIAFFSCEVGGKEGDIRILDLASHKLTVVPGSTGTRSPRWSPDGRYLAATSDDQETLKLFNIETQKWSILFQGGLVAFPSWSGDSRFIYFERYGSDFNVSRILVKGGLPERVLDLKDLHIVGWFGWVGLDPTDAPLILRDTGADDIYALTLEEK